MLTESVDLILSLMPLQSFPLGRRMTADRQLDGISEFFVSRRTNVIFFNSKLFVQFISDSFSYEQTLQKYIPIPEEKEIVVI